MISVTFFAFGAKLDKQGKLPIYARIMRNEEDKASTSTKIKVAPENWDGFTVQEGDPLASIYNAMLEKVKSDILRLFVIHPTEQCSVLKEIYKDSFKKKYAINDLVNEYVDYKISELKNYNSKRTYKTQCKALQSFLKLSGLLVFDADQFAYAQTRSVYQNILNKPKSTIYANKIIRLLKGSLAWGYGEKKINSYYLQEFKLKTVKKKQITSNDYLSVNEVVQLITVDAPAKFDQVKALAAIQIFTGMAYVDVMNPEKRKFLTINSQPTIMGNRTKTGGEYIIPLHEVAINVLEKYGWDIPTISNAKYNDYLKVLASYARIDKNITTHSLRRTFTQMMRDNGVSDEVVAKMLGHADTRMLKWYSHISQDRVLKEYSPKELGNAA